MEIIQFTNKKITYPNLDSGKQSLKVHLHFQAFVASISVEYSLHFLALKILEGVY